ncbi:MAG: hypothetical protein VB125_04150 [Burkholderia sp.]
MHSGQDLCNNAHRKPSVSRCLASNGPSRISSVPRQIPRRRMSPVPAQHEAPWEGRQEPRH